MNEVELEQLKARVSELEAWKAAREKQQIVLPLDPQSVEILNQYFLSLKDVYVYEVTGASSNAVVEVIGQQKNFPKQTSDLFSTNKVSIGYSVTDPYTVDPSTDVLTLSEGSILNDTAISFYTSNTGPTGLTVGNGTIYYVRDSTGRTFKVAATVGGAAINITSTGTGRQFIQRVI